MFPTIWYNCTSSLCIHVYEALSPKKYKHNYYNFFVLDEALARRLQEEEDSKVGKRRQKKHHKFRHLTEPSSLAVIAAENYRAHHNSSPPQSKGALGSSPQTGGGLMDIMGEQMAQQVQEAEVVRMP